MHNCSVRSLKLLINISPSILPSSSWNVLQVTEAKGCTLRTPLLHLLSFDNPLTPILYVTLKLKKVLFIHVYNYIVSSTWIVTQKS